MEWWNNGIIAFHAIICQYPNTPFPQFFKSNIPLFQHSIIPVVSAANLSLKLFFFYTDFTVIMLYNSAMKIYQYVIKGNVQGVAFRYYTVRIAQNLSIKGTVKNLSNGDVEVYAQGETENIRRFEAFLHSGPPAAVVDGVTREELDSNEGFPGFEIIY
jgi:acylphosphatase